MATTANTKRARRLEALDRSPTSDLDDPELKKAKPPWLLVTLAFGLPFLILVVLSFLH
jgi:hypothetical protein